MTKTLVSLALFFSAQAQSATWVQTPKGNYAVEQTPGGFVVYGMSGQGITEVIRTGDGYSVLSPQGVTNVYEDGRTSNPNMTVDPFNLEATPIPNMGD